MLLCSQCSPPPATTQVSPWPNDAALLCVFAAVLVADAGALPEAAAGAAAAVLPLGLVHFPAVASSPALGGSVAAQQQQQQRQQHGVAYAGKAQQDDAVHLWQADQRSWHDRTYPQLQQQHVDAWAAAVQQVLSSRTAYLQHSRQAKAAAEQVFVKAPELLQQLLGWLRESDGP
jgi:hypothetical protein